MKRRTRILPSEITPESAWHSRREFLAGLAGASLAAVVPAAVADEVFTVNLVEKPLEFKANARYSTGGKAQFLRRGDRLQQLLRIRHGQVRSCGECAPVAATALVASSSMANARSRARFALEDLLRPHPLEERVYRLRCVEAWSMVIPWIGFPLGDLVRRFKPTSRAKYVEFTTLLDPKQMPGQRYPVLDWPYVEGLRIDEAMHPLAILAVGLYGKPLPNQNGAPLRLVVPWKYGFKSVKSIVRIRFVERMPKTSWALSAPREYGFFANVNPQVDHPRWSQKSERRIGAGNFLARQPTLKFNGYADEVAGLYRGMDLARWF